MFETVAALLEQRERESWGERGRSGVLHNSGILPAAKITPTGVIQKGYIDPD